MNKQEIEIVGAGTGEDKLLPDFTELETKLLMLSLGGDSPLTIARKLRVPESFVRTFLNKNKVKAYVREQKELAAEIVQLKIQGLLTEVLEERIDACEGDMSKLTKKDTLDVLKLLQEVSSGIVKGSQQSESDDKYAAILGRVMKDG